MPSAAALKFVSQEPVVNCIALVVDVVLRVLLVAPAPFMVLIMVEKFAFLIAAVAGELVLHVTRKIAAVVV